MKRDIYSSGEKLTICSLENSAYVDSKDSISTVVMRRDLFETSGFLEFLQPIAREQNDLVRTCGGNLAIPENKHLLHM